jgi:hypothetical protein
MLTIKTNLSTSNSGKLGLMASSSQAPDPQNPRNETSKLESEALWSSTHHPNILGQLDPHPDRALLKNQKVPDLMEIGEVVNDSENKPIKDFPFLPRYLSSNLELFRYEAYFRMDPRLTYRDLWPRMPSTTPKFDRKTKTKVGTNFGRQIREHNNAHCWNLRGHQLPRTNVEVVENLTQEQIELNTTWNVTSDGIRQPCQSPISSPLPRNYFLASGEIGHTLGPALQNARNELQRLQRIAERKGRNSWKDVPEDHPHQWTARHPENVPEREAAEAMVQVAAAALLELVGQSNVIDETASEEQAAASTLLKLAGIHSAQSVAPDREETGANDQPISNETDDMDDGSTQADEDMHDGSTQADEDEVRYVARAMQTADGTFSKS